MISYRFNYCIEKEDAVTAGMSIEELTAALREQAELIDQIGEGYLMIGTVTGVIGDRVRIVTSQGPGVAKLPKAYENQIEAGTSVSVHSETKQIVGMSPFERNGRIVSVKEVHGEYALIEVSAGERRLVPILTEVKPGDRVMTDEYSSVVLSVLPLQKQRFVVENVNVSWDDIGGQELAKEALRSAIELPYLFPEVYKHYGQPVSGGVLMVGPPGCGKTMLAKAAATSVGAKDGFIHCKGPEVLDPYVGVAEANVRSMFDRARTYHRETGRKGVIFVDEADAILGHRNARNAYMEKTIVPMFLAEMDGLEDSGATVILATNQGHSLDTAVVRPGRIDTKVTVVRPDQRDSFEVMLTHLKKAPLQGELAELAEKAVVQMFGAKFHNAGQVHALGDWMSGAFIAGVVTAAKNNALKRDIQDKTLTGVGELDLTFGVETMTRQMSSVALDNYN